MKEEMFAELVESIKQAVLIRRGAKRDRGSRCATHPGKPGAKPGAIRAIDRRESSHGAKLGTEAPRTGGCCQGLADCDRPQPAGGARSIACCIGDREFHHSRRCPSLDRCCFRGGNFSNNLIRWENE